MGKILGKKMGKFCQEITVDVLIQQTLAAMAAQVDLLSYNTVCPRSSDPFYVVTCYIKWVTTSWTDSI